MINMKVCECGHGINIHMPVGCIMRVASTGLVFCPCFDFIESFESLVQQALDAAQVQALTEVTNEKES